MKRLLLLTLLLLPCIQARATSYDFSYEYGDPFLSSSQTYIVNSSNVELWDEGLVRFWKPKVGAATFAATTPGVVTYHFNFGQATSEIFLWMGMPTFHWSYSQGHNFLHGSVDGSTWVQLADITPPAFGSAHDLGTVTIPDGLLGAQDLWLKAELYSFGPLASSGGVYTNTAQLSRWDKRSPSTTKSFRLGVNFTQIPEPGTLLLFLLGLVGTYSIGRGRRHQRHPQH